MTNQNEVDYHETILAERPISVELIRTQPELSHEGKVEVYEMGLTASIPTIFQGFLLPYNIMGNERDAIIVSPNGLTASEHYPKPVKELRLDVGRTGCYTGEGPGQLRHTDEDTARYWLLESQKFREELAAKGWMIFPERTETSKWYKRELGLKDNEGYVEREFKLKDFIRVLELVNGTGLKQRDYSRNIADLSELTGLGEKITYLWGGSSMFYMSARYKDQDFMLKLDGVSSAFKDRPLVEPDTLTRKVMIRTELHSNPAEDVTTLIEDYAKQKKLNLRVERREEGTLIHSICDRKFLDKVATADTRALLEQAVELRNFAESVVKQETRYNEVQNKGRLNAKRVAIGLAPVL